MNRTVPEHEDRLLRRQDVEAITSLGKVCIYRRVQDGSFPRPVQLGGRRVAWRLSEIRRWMSERPAAGGGIKAASSQGE
jgi:prophage regulatory protein